MKIADLNPEWPLRLGLGAMYGYSGFSLITRPLDWQGFLPLWLSGFIAKVMPFGAYLSFQGAGELAMAFIFLAWFLPRWSVRIAAGLAAAEMFLIIAVVGIDLATFRDLGLLGAAVSLFLLLRFSPYSEVKF